MIGNDVFSVGLDAEIKPEDLKKTKENLYYSCAEMILEKKFSRRILVTSVVS